MGLRGLEACATADIKVKTTAMASISASLLVTSWKKLT
jgi:hypothetical protein